MAQDYHCIAIWHDKKWRREEGEKGKKENGKNKGKKQEKARAFVPPNGTVL